MKILEKFSKRYVCSEFLVAKFCPEAGTPKLAYILNVCIPSTNLVYFDQILNL